MIQPIVEGQGDETAMPELLRRLIYEALGIDTIQVARPVRQQRSELISAAGIRRAVQYARLRNGVTAILVTFDLDDDCARDLVPNLLNWGQQEAQPIPFGVALARREYEAWFLAALSSLAGKRRIHPDAVAPPDPEAIRGAKERLSSFMPSNRPYVEPLDQVPLSAQMDLGQAYRGASSFRKLVRELCRLLTELGHHPQIPPEWTGG